MSSSTPQSLRLFIAVHLSEAARQAVTELQNRLRDVDQDQAIRWTAPDNIHLTLKFLGDVNAEGVNVIEEDMGKAANGLSPFSLNVDRVGVFPGLRKINVVWAGVSGEVGSLHRLRDAVEAHIAPLGYPTEARPFTAHLTLGRTKQGKSAKALREYLQGDVEIGKIASWQVDFFSLMKSDLLPSGAVYTEIFRVTLPG